MSFNLSYMASQSTIYIVFQLPRGHVFTLGSNHLTERINTTWEWCLNVLGVVVLFMNEYFITRRNIFEAVESNVREKNVTYTSVCIIQLDR